MISAANDWLGRKYAWKPQITSFYVILVVLLLAATFVLSLQVRGATVIRVKHVGATYTAGTPAQVVAAWGKPDSQVDGASVNQALAGTTCAVYQSKHAIICY